MLKPPVIITPPESEPITYDQAKAHLKIDSDDEQGLIESLIIVARMYAENYLDGPIMTTVVDQCYDNFPACGEMLLPAPLQEVASVKYFDENVDEQSWSSAEYEVDTLSKPGRLRPISGYSYPCTARRYNAVTARCTIGYADPPGPILQAMKMAIGAFYANRELIAEVMAGNLQEVPRIISADALMYPYRIFQ